jgi:hypothetical protein
MYISKYVLKILINMLFSIPILMNFAYVYMFEQRNN